ncbi:HAD family hydrolase [Demequina sediminicola]|uniref:HAD family hydrolase n=1 Tax=Demequina sediminicola TaxID=1095026 RepID=UPI0007857590|nr:HAD-IB family hydrolase [Demequina sediminicola]
MTSDSPSQDSRAAAFFDVDNTVIRGATSYHLARGLQRHGFFRAHDVLRFAWEQTRYVLLGENRDQINSLREEALSIIKGWTVAEMVAVAEEVYDEVLVSRIFPGTRALIDEHLSAGREVWFITTAPQEVGTIIAKRLGATGAQGSQAEHVDGHYTGRLKGEMLHREAKATAVHALAEERGFDLSKSYAYGDSINDGPMLESVGNPCAINPDSKLRNLASQRGWEVKEFRKRRKNGRQGLMRASAAGAVWATVAVGRGVKATLKGALGRSEKKASVHDDQATHL